MKKIYLLLLVIGISVISCRKGDAPEPIVLGEIINHFVSLEQAKKIAVLTSMFRYVSPKSSEKLMSTERGQKSLDTTKRKSIMNVKSVDFDQRNASFYIINYNDGGFAIVSGDDRTPPILAESEKSSFPVIEGGYYPSGLVAWLSNTNDKIKNIRKDNIKQSNATKAAWDEVKLQSKITTQGYVKTLADRDPEFPPCLVEGQVINTVYERVANVQTTWGQGVGYNDALDFQGCSSYSNGKPPVGCVATAVAQIMKFHQFPTAISWASMPLNYGQQPPRP